MVKGFKDSLVGIDEDETEDLDDDAEEMEENEEEASESELVSDFDKKESEHNKSFQFYAKRISCFAHTLQLVVVMFDKNESVQRVVKRAFALVKKFNKSSKATERLVSLCGKKLISNCPTRWNSTFLLIERLLDIKNHVTTVAEEQEWDNLPISEWKVLDNVYKFLKPFAQYTSLISGSECTTISCVIPIIMELQITGVFYTSKSQ